MTEGKNDFWLGTNEGIFRYPGGNSPDNTSLADSRVVKLIPDGGDGFIVVSRTGIGFLSEGQTGISRVMERGKGDFDDTVNVIAVRLIGARYGSALTMESQDMMRRQGWLSLCRCRSAWI